ncbi:MAG: restriction endonuclease subunit S [Gemmatimonadales bacterium]
MADWRETTLGEICDEVGGVIQTGPFGSQLHESDYAPEGVPVVMPKDIVDGRIATDSVARVSPEHVERLSRHKLRSGDIVYGRRGDIGRQALIRPEQEGWMCGTGCLRLSFGESVLNPLFLHYYLRQDDVVTWITNQAVGATMPNLNTGILRTVPVRFPPLPVQRRIAGILSAYDELIENSLRRIRLLEAMARALYREWFVHFRFPGHEKLPRVASPLGDMPQGWEVKPLSALCSRMESGGTPKRNTPEYWEGGDIEWFKTGELWDGFLFGSEEKITERGQRESNARIFEPGTILMAIYGSPTVGRLGIVTRPSSCNQAALGLVADTEHISQTFLYFVLLSLRDHFNGLAQGAAQQNISKEKVANAAALVPPRPLVTAFDRLADPTFSQVQVLQRQIHNLRRTRDLLLPRLLSGQLEVKAP